MPCFPETPCSMDPLKTLLKHYWGLVPDATEQLVGELSLNYRVSAGGKQLVFKDAPAQQQSVELLREENRVLEKLSRLFPGSFQQPISTCGGENLVLGPDGKRVYRLLSYVEGSLLAESEHSPELFRSFGDLLARLDLAMDGLDCPRIAARRYDWDNANFDQNRESIACISR